MSDFDLLKDTPELTAAIKRDRERIMNDADKQTIKRYDFNEITKGYHIWHEMADAIDGEWVKYEDHKRIADSQALEIERLNKIIDEISDEGNR